MTKWQKGKNKREVEKFINNLQRIQLTVLLAGVNRISENPVISLMWSFRSRNLHTVSYIM